VTVKAEVVKLNSAAPCDKYSGLFSEGSNKSRFLAQCHQESLGNPLAKSPFAEGLMQFTPQTAEWAESSFCRHLGKARLTSAWWSAKCAEAYMSWIEERTPSDGSYCSTKRNAERGYNGGLGWLTREAKLTSDHSYDGLIQVCSDTGRALWACRENSSYSDRISRHQKILYANHGGRQCQ